MKINLICNVIVENTSGKVLVRKTKEGYVLPSSLVLSNSTMRESISDTILSTSIEDIPDTEYIIFNVSENKTSEELSIVVTYYGETKKVRFSKEKVDEGYMFISLSKLKSIISEFNCKSDSLVLRRYILRGVSLISDYE